MPLLDESTPEYFAASKAYHAAVTLCAGLGDTGYPSWDQLPENKRLFFTNACRAALDGKPVHEVWAYSVGADPDDATLTHWKTRPARAKLLANLFFLVGSTTRECLAFEERADRNARVEEVEEGHPELEFNEEDLQAIDDAEIDTEEKAEAITKANTSAKSRK